MAFSNEANAESN